MFLPLFAYRAVERFLVVSVRSGSCLACAAHEQSHQRQLDAAAEIAITTVVFEGGIFKGIRNKEFYDATTRIS